MKLVPGPTTGAGDRAVLALHDPDRGSVVISTPRPGSPARVMSEVLMALDKPVRGMAQTVSVRSIRDDVDLWLRAYDVRQLIVLHAGTLEPEAIEELGSLEVRLSLSLTLLADEASLARVRLTAPHQIQPGLATALQALDAVERIRSVPAASIVLPISPEQFATARRRVPFAAAFAAAAGIEPDHRATVATLAPDLRTALTEFIDPICLAAAARGAGIALREYGWLLRPATPAEARRYSSITYPGVVGSAAATLRRFTNALLTSVGALVLIGLSEDEMLELLALDVADDGASVRVGRDILSVPPSLRPLLRAQWLVINEQDRSQGLPYLGAPEASGRRRLRQLIDAATEDLADVNTADVRERGGQNERWLLDRGLALERTALGRRPARSGTYDPVKFMADLRSELAADWISPTSTRVDCGCGRPHDPPRRAELPDWPPAVTRGNAADHPWKSQSGSSDKRVMS